MAVTLPHPLIPAKDKRAAARLFAAIFGLTVQPSEGRFAPVPLDEPLTLDFAAADHTRGLLHVVPNPLESHHDTTWKVSCNPLNLRKQFAEGFFRAISINL